MQSQSVAKRKILLVDDDLSLLSTVGPHLKYEGYDVSTAESGESALEVLKTVKPHLIILDMSMPGMGGVGFLQRITGSDGKPQYPVLVLTARAQMAEFFANLDIDGFMAKPMDPEDLLMEVSRILFQRGADEGEAGVPSDDVPLRTVVLGDRHADSVAALREAFEAAGYSVEVAPTGAVALELAVTVKPDVIVLRADVAELETDGLLRLVRKLPSLRNVPVVLYGFGAQTGSWTPDDLTVLVDEATPEAVLPVVGQLL